MSTISNLIFNNANHYITSKFGARSIIKTPAGDTSTTHNGVDYGTNGIKRPQYAIEDGYVFAATKSNSDGALYVWVIYPRIKKAFLHYHLDSYTVKAGQKVSKGTLIGYTGKTGKATGVHLHLGVRELSKLSDKQINNMTWDLIRTCDYIDAEKISYSAPDVKPTGTNTSNSNSFLHKRGYFKKGDISANIGKIAKFMYATFPKYTKKSALGNVFGKNLQSAIIEFQSRTGLVPDGYIGKLTLSKLKEFGFKE